MAKTHKKKYNHKQIKSKVPEKTLLASAHIRHGTDTAILQEDLYREFLMDANNTDTGLLVNDKWVRFFDPTSSFLKGMIALVSNSTTSRNIINQKTTLTLGDGFVPIASDVVPFLQTLRKLFRLKTAEDSAIEEINELIGNVNLNNETLEEVIEKVTFDWWAFGNGMVQLTKATRGGKDIVFMYHLPLEMVGIHKANANNIIESVGITANWDVDGFDPSKIKEIPLYPNFNSDGNSVIHIKNYAPGFFYWGLPENIASRFWQEIEYRIPKYNIAKFKNQFKPSAWIQAFGSFTDAEADELISSFEDFYTDTGNNSRLLVQIMKSNADKAIITQFDDKTEGDWMELQKLATQAIITANRWTPSLSGIALSGKLGSNQQMREELEFVTNTTIKQGRRKIMQGIVNPFIAENQKVNKKLNGVMLHVVNSNPIGLAGLLSPKDILTRDEQRDIFGFEAIGEPEPTEEGDQATTENQQQEE